MKVAIEGHGLRRRAFEAELPRMREVRPGKGNDKRRRADQGHRQTEEGTGPQTDQSQENGKCWGALPSTAC